MTPLVFKNIIKWNTTTLILLLLLTVPHPTYAWHKVLGKGDKIIFNKDFLLAPGRSIDIFKTKKNNTTFECQLTANKSNRKTILIKSGKHHNIYSAGTKGFWQLTIQVAESIEYYPKESMRDSMNPSRDRFEISLTYLCSTCDIDLFSSDCGGLITIIHQKPLEF